MTRKILRVLMVSAVLVLFGPMAGSASAFTGEGCMGDCKGCHTLGLDEARKLLKTERFRADIKEVRMSPVKGLWEVEIAQAGKTVIVYVDFGKKYLVEARFTQLDKLEEETKLKKVDLAVIPLDEAIVIGDPGAKNRIIVFDDPECPYCAKLHAEIKKVIEQRKDVVFYIKMYPLPIHPDAYAKSKAIVCSGSSALLDDAFAGKPLPEPDCETKEVDRNVKLAAELGIRGTPAIIFPDGRMLPGYVPADVLLWHLDNP
ncbi:MAG: DsbC family protein [Thermodesulfobacteriota bacterium]